IPPEVGARYLADELHCPQGPVEVVVLAESGVEPKAPPAPPPLPVAFERGLGLEGYPVLESNVLDGRPVVPMALLAEWLGHAALHHNPGLTFHGLEELRVLHGVVLDVDALTLRVCAGKAVARDGLFAAPAEVRSVRPDGREVLHARAEVLLAAGL